MREDDFYEDEERSPSTFLLLLAGLAFLLALAALAWAFLLQGRLSNVENAMQQNQTHDLQLLAEQAETRRELRATSDALGEKMGLTQRQIEQRARQLQRQQQTATDRLALQQAEIRQQVGNVTTAVTTVKTDVGGVKQDVAANTRDVATTKQELATTEQELYAAIGDMGVQSGLIAKNGEELEYLKHLGDRNYYEFTLYKGKPSTNVSTIKLQLRKADVRHSRYTLEVFSDDKKLEKKNRQIDEPLQFYSGKQPVLYEIVINEIGKNDVSGYLSTPKHTRGTEAR